MRSTIAVSPRFTFAAKFTIDDRGRCRAVAKVRHNGLVRYAAPGAWCVDERRALASALRALAVVVGA